MKLLEDNKNGAVMKVGRKHGLLVNRYLEQDWHEVGELAAECD